MVSTAAFWDSMLPQNIPVWPHPCASEMRGALDDVAVPMGACPPHLLYVIYLFCGRFSSLSTVS
jgi:hypothetical protein